MIPKICLWPSLNSQCATLHQIQRQSWGSDSRISISYLIRLSHCWMILLRSKVTRNPCTIWCVSSRIQTVEIKHLQYNSLLKAMFILMLYLWRDRSWILLEYIIYIMTEMSLIWIFNWNIIQWVALEGWNGYCVGMASMAANPGFLRNYYVHSIIWCNFLKYQHFSGGFVLGTSFPWF